MFSTNTAIISPGDNDSPQVVHHLLGSQTSPGFEFQKPLDEGYGTGANPAIPEMVLM